MALSCRPKLLIADEPTTALDVTIQAQILELLRKLQDETGMAMLLITHDLGVVAENADTVAVMYASRVVETARVEDIFDRPQHPYTEGLLRSVPKLGHHTVRLETIPGQVPNPANFPSGCKFHTRCPRTREAALAAGAAPEAAVGVEVASDGAVPSSAPAPQNAAEPGAAHDVLRIVTGEESASVLRICVQEEPNLREVRREHWGACHLIEGYPRAPLTRASLDYYRHGAPGGAALASADGSAPSLAPVAAIAVEHVHPPQHINPPERTDR
jgi:oligopeptide/dipeptide ABC transporter ATP-binding protein